LDRLVGHGQQLAVQPVQVDLVAQSHGEPLHGAGGVIAAAVAPVDQPLDTASQRLERGGDGQRGAGLR